MGTELPQGTRGGLVSSIKNYVMRIHLPTGEIRWARMFRTLGETSRTGDITLSTNLRMIPGDERLVITIRHESFHRFFSPTSGSLQSARGLFNEVAYNLSKTIKAVEEFGAESFATASLRSGWRYLGETGINISGRTVAVEVGLASGLVVAGGYLFNEKVLQHPWVQPYFSENDFVRGLVSEIAVGRMDPIILQQGRASQSGSPK
jgi:hypothetical protein